MKRIIISEDEKKDILSKYTDNIDKSLLLYLRRNFPVSTVTLFDDIKMKKLTIEDKWYTVEDNKSYLTKKLKLEVQDVFPGLSEQLLVKTIRYFLDLILTSDY